MIHIKQIRENPDEVKALLEKRNVKVDIEQILSLDTKRSELMGKTEELRGERNKVSKVFNEENKNRGSQIKEELKKLEPELDEIQKQLKMLLLELPNTLDPHTPIGKEEKESVEIKKVGIVPKFDFTPLDHVDIGKKLDIIDFEKGAKVTGSQFYFLKNEAVLLEQALIRYAFDFLLKEKFSLIETPDLAKISVLEGIGFKPRGPETQVYTIEGTDLGLVGTAEITLGGYHKDEIIEEKALPIKYAGLSHCFRTEAGGYGRYSRGLYRVHQFTKVEMFIYCLPEKSAQMHDYLLSLEEKIYQELEIPYRVVDIVSGDLGAPAVRKYDLEGWMPGRNDWGEITSTSNCTDYQAARLNIKYRKQDGSTQYIHMLNGTAVAISRALIVILENNQQKDGTVIVPKVLRPYLSRDRIGQA